MLAAVFFFVPGALVINELSSRFPEEGGLYAWSREAFGPFHGFVAGWTYWIYTFFYFPGLLLASASMAAYIMGGSGAALAQNRTFLLTVSLSLLPVAVVLNIIGLNIGKWLQNAGGVGTYVPAGDAGRHRRRLSAGATAPPPTSPPPTCCPPGTGTRSTSGRRSPLPLPASSSSPP